MAQTAHSQDFLLDLQIQISVLNLVATAIVAQSPDREALTGAIRLLADQVKANTEWPEGSGIEPKIDAYLASIIG